MLGKLLMQVRSEVTEPGKSWRDMDEEEQRAIIDDFIGQAIEHKKNTLKTVGYEIE